MHMDGQLWYCLTTMLCAFYCVQAATPGGMEYGIEDGEIVMDESEEEGQDVEYDPLMAGNVEVFFHL